MIAADFDMLKNDEIQERYTWSEIALNFTARIARNAWRLPEK